MVEAGDRSGALITARHAMEQGREVFAVPGQIDNPDAAGPHRLLRDGAKMVTCIDDVLEEFGHLPSGRTLVCSGRARRPSAADQFTPPPS